MDINEMKIDGIWEIADMMIEDACNLDRFQEVSAIVKYEDARELIKYILLDEDVTLLYANLHDVEWEGYDREYFVSLDDEFNLTIEPAWNYEKEFYLGYEAEVVYIADDCNTAVLKKNENDKAEIWSFGLEEDEDDDEDCTPDPVADHCDGDCENCAMGKPAESSIKIGDNFHVDEKGRVIVDKEKTTIKAPNIKAESSYFVNGKEATKEEYDKASADIKKRFDEFDAKWRKAMLPMLEVMDNVNDLRRMIW